MVEDVVAAPRCVELDEDISIDHGLPLRAFFLMINSSVVKKELARIIWFTTRASHLLLLKVRSFFSTQMVHHVMSLRRSQILEHLVREIESLFVGTHDIGQQNALQGPCFWAFMESMMPMESPMLSLQFYNPKTIAMVLRMSSAHMWLLSSIPAMSPTLQEFTATSLR